MAAMSGFRVRASMCETCIYRPEQGADFVKRLEDQVRDPNMEGHFRGHRECHDKPKGACCRGFWNRHKDRFDLGQLAQRLGFVRFVKEGD